MVIPTGIELPMRSAWQAEREEQVRDRVGTVDEIPSTDETYNPWTVVNLVFHHLAAEGLHPVLGEHGDPGAAARELLRALGITPAIEGNRQIMRDVYAHLAEIRTTVFPGDEASRG
jgi:hypothetical protein